MKFVENVYEGGIRRSTLYQPILLVRVYADIAKDVALPLIAHADRPATEESIHTLLKQAIVAVTFLGMTVEAAANQAGETIFSGEFEAFDRCRGRFGKGVEKSLPEAVKKWYWLFKAKSRESDYVARVQPGLATLFQDARNALVHYKPSKSAAKYEVEQPTTPHFRVIYSVNDPYLLKEPGIIAALKPSAVRSYYEAVRLLFLLWNEVNGFELAAVHRMLPPPQGEGATDQTS